MKPVVSVLMPARHEAFLTRTVDDVLTKVVDPLEIIVILDGDPASTNGLIADPRVQYLSFPEVIGMRAAVAAAVTVARGEFLWKLDAHCLVAPGIDRVLRAAVTQPNQIVIPRRYRLDDETWQPRWDEGPVDYEYFIDPRKFTPLGLHGFHWIDRTQARLAIEVDDTLTFQGSSWFMPAAHFRAHAFMEDPGYQGLPQQEAEELGLTTWLSGGRVTVTKATWYAHLFKGKKHGRGYHIDRARRDACYRYAFQRWVIDRRPAFAELLQRFWPLPGWTEDWSAKLDRAIARETP